MTSRSPRKPPITRQSTRRWSPSRTALQSRVWVLLLFGLLIVPFAQPTAEAGKKRREASIDQLRERDPSDRWKNLQKLWRPLADDPPESAVEQRLPEPPLAAPAIPVPQPSATPSYWNRIAAPAAQPPSAPTAGGPLQTSDKPVGLQAPVVETTPPPTGPAREVAEPVWFIEDAETRPHNTKRVAGAQSETIDPNRRDRMNMGAEATPKPITSILPYYDYAPEGGSPCEFLCPTPEGCELDSLSRPCPDLVQMPDIPFESRMFAETHVAWEASNLFSNPLYFEDASLERYGHTHHELLQPFVSLGKFSVQLVGLPYQMALHPPHEHRYALGWYRPGECAPYKYYLPPWNAKAALTAGAAYVGAFYLIP